MSENKSNQLLITDLSNDILEKILSKLSYDEIAQKRAVCKKFDSVCKEILNHNSKLLKNQIETYVTEVKRSLPRRESVRKSHPRNRHLQVLEDMYFYFNCLYGTYSFFMEKNLCCFIAGIVLDEAARILKLVKSTEILPKSADKITDEMREISNMAIDHFEEVVQPPLEAVLVAHRKEEQENKLVRIRKKDDALKLIIPLPAVSGPTKEIKPSPTFGKINYRIKKNKFTVLSVKGQLGIVRSKLHKQTETFKKLLLAQNQTLIELKNHIECIEQELSCLRVDVKK